MKAILVIDMPKECCDGCPCYYEEAYRCQVHMETDEDLYDGKPSWCPLRPLPKKKHGRLIDADAYLKKVCTYRETGCGSCRFQTVCPQDEPTIVEADKAESENA